MKFISEICLYTVNGSTIPILLNTSLIVTFHSKSIQTNSFSLQNKSHKSIINRITDGDILRNP